MALVHLQTPKVSKYIFYESDSYGRFIKNNESIVFQRSLDINRADLFEFIEKIIGDQYKHASCKKIIDPPDFHGDKLKDKFGNDIPINLFLKYKHLIVNDFFIGSNQYHFYGVGIDIHTGDTFTRIKKGEEVTQPTPKDKQGNIEIGYIEIKYRCPDPKELSNENKGRIIKLNFHIKEYDGGDGLNASLNMFTNQLRGMFGKNISRGCFVENKQEYIQKLEGIDISNFETVLDENGNTFRVANESEEIYKFLVSNYLSPRYKI